MPAQSDLRFTFTAGVDQFDVIEFHLIEALSDTFALDVDLSCANPDVDFGQVLDQSALLTIWQGGQPVRYVHGLVSSFQQGNTGFRRTRYRATVEPQLARLHLSSDWRIFQDSAVTDIAKTVLKKHGITLAYEQLPTHPHLPREYCVQAGDTDYHFVERIMREEGFFYGFQHGAEGHRLIHCDRMWIFGRLDGPAVEYNPMPGGDRPTPAISSFLYTENVRPARQTQRDYDFKNPRYDHHTESDGENLANPSRGYERYDYPGRYKNVAGVAFTRDRLRGLRGQARIAVVQGDDARLTPGVSFDLTGHPREAMNRAWRPISIEHHGKQYTSQAEESADANEGTHYSLTATLVPDDVEWRAEPLPKPRIDGPQQATVVGPPGEEIYCDSYGRVKVQFPWDREGRHDEHSSCWIRVSQSVAGALWGHVAIPRIGQEVIVSNFDGDPDQPVITGRNYNALQLPPYELPANKTRMTIKSQTHKGNGFNEMRFEDEAGQEEIFIHAQKDQNIHVNHDETISVGNDQAIGVVRDRTTNIGRDEVHTTGRDRKEHIRQDTFSTIDRNEIRKVGNSLKQSIAASHLVDIGENQTLVIEGVQSTEARTALRTLTKEHILQGTERILVRGPNGKIVLDASGITLDGANIFLKGNVQVLSTSGAQNAAIEAAIKEGSPLIEECPLASDAAS